MTRFSVVIPTYGRPDFLAEAIASVLAQPHDLECVVVDDASPQAVPVSDDPRVRVVRRAENGGPAAARNTGIAASRGAVVCFLDDDDVWLPGRLELAERGLSRAPITTCWARFLDEPRGTGRGRQLDGDVSATILDGLTPSLGTVSVRREALVTFTEGMDNLEDVDWWMRQAARARVATVPVVGLAYRRHDGVRLRTNLRARVDANVAFLEANALWFAAHPRAAAFRWKRVGLLAAQLGDRSLARRALVRSTRLRPEVATVAHLVRSLA